MPPDPRILVIRRRYIGDLVLLGAFLANLRRHRPGARLVVATEPGPAAVVGLNPDVDAVMTLPEGPLCWPPFVRRLRAERFTHVFDIDNTARTALVARLTGASFRAVLFLENVRRHLPGWYTHSALVQSADYEKQSIVDSQLSLLATAEVPVTTREFRLVPWKEDLESADRLLGGGAAQHGVRRLLVHPGTRSRHRLWPVERFAAVCDRLQDDLGAQVFLVAGPGEQDLVSAIRDKAQSHIVALNAPLEIGAFAALASRFDAMLCHDSGPMHVAAAVGTPVVALFGSQNAAVWGPVGPRHVVLRPPLPCTACPTPDVCVPGDSYNNHCVRNIPADRAFDALRQVLSAK